MGGNRLAYPVEAREHPIEGTVVPAGDMATGVLEFVRLPGPGIGLLSASPGSLVYIVYNDGTNYSARQLDVNGAI